MVKDEVIKEEVNEKGNIKKVRQIKTRGEEEMVMAEIDSW